MVYAWSCFWKRSAVVRIEAWVSSIFCDDAFASKIGVPVKPKSWALGKNALIALWFSPNCERWHSSKMKTMRLSLNGASISL